MSILINKHKEVFNAMDEQHMIQAVDMLEKNSWGAEGCPFRVTAPYLSVVDEIKAKIIQRVIAERKGHM